MNNPRMHTRYMLLALVLFCLLTTTVVGQEWNFLPLIRRPLPPTPTPVPPAPTPSPTPDSGLIFSDDFSDPKSGWTVYNDGEFRSDYIGGEYSIRVKIPDGNGLGIAPREFNRCSLRIDAAETSWASGLLAIMYGFDDDGDGYMLALVPWLGYHGLVRSKGDDIVWLQDLTWSPHIDGAYGTDRIRIDWNEPHHAIYINGHLVTTAHDDEIRGEGLLVLGVGAMDDGNVEMRFDDLAAYRLRAAGGPASAAPDAPRGNRPRGGVAPRELTAAERAAIEREVHRLWQAARQSTLD